MKVTKTKNENGTFSYRIDGQRVKKTSKREYKYALVAVMSGTIEALGNKIDGFGSTIRLKKRTYPRIILEIIKID